MDDAERAARRARMRAAMGPDSSAENSGVSDDKNEPSSKVGVKKGCLWLFGGVFGLALVGAIFGDPPKNEVSKDTNETQVAGADVVDNEVMKGWYQSILDTAKPCDAASGAMAEAMTAFASGRGSTLSVYQAATRAEESCRRTSMTYRGLDVPNGLPEKVEKAIDEAHETCSNGFVLKQMAAEKAAEVFDGAMSNSNITRLQQLANDGQTGVFACVAASLKAVGEAGIDSETIASWGK